jgi:small-conductance mechanosensitive channel
VAYGVIGAGLAVALQDVVKNLAGSIVILITGVYRVGNRIEINDTMGDVIDIGLFTTTMLEVREWLDADQATGRITTVPNGVVLTKPVQNYTKLHKYLWDELAIELTAESNWEEAMNIMSEIGETHTEQFVDDANKSLTRLERYYYVEGHVLKPNAYITPTTNGYTLTLRYVVDAWKRRTTNSDIWSDIIKAFAERSDIVIAPRTIASQKYPEAKK